MAKESGLVCAGYVSEGVVKLFLPSEGRSVVSAAVFDEVIDNTGKFDATFRWRPWTAQLWQRGLTV